MADAHQNFAYTTVSTAPSPATSGTSLVVAAGTGTRFPAPPFNATIWPAGAVPTPANAEVVRVTAVSTDTLTITRAQESSAARTVVVNDQIAAALTAGLLDQFLPLTGAEVTGAASLTPSNSAAPPYALVVDEATTNLITNPSFETATTGWAAVGGTTLTRVNGAGQAFAGSWGLRINKTSAVAGNGASFVLTGLTAGQTYVFSMYIAPTVATVPMGVQLKVVDNATAPVTTLQTPPVSANINWARYSVPFTVGTGGTQATLSIIGTVSQNLDVIIDAVQVENKTQATTYADGSLGSGYAWTGTAHASTSTRTAGTKTLGPSTGGALVVRRDGTVHIGDGAEVDRSFLPGFSVLQNNPWNAQAAAILGKAFQRSTDAGGSALLPVGVMGQASIENTTAGSFDHCIGVLGLNQPGVGGVLCALGNGFYGVEGRCDNYRTGAAGYGTLGLGSLYNTTSNSGSYAVGVRARAELQAGTATGGAFIAAWVTTNAPSGLQSGWFNAILGDSSNNVPTAFRGAIQSANHDCLFYILDATPARDRGLFVTSTGSNFNAFIFQTREAAGASEFSVKNSNGTRIFHSVSSGVGGLASGNSLVASVTPANTSETQVVVATYPADFMQVGTTFRIVASGVLTTAGAAPTLTFRVRTGTTTLTGNIATSVVPTLATSQTGVAWYFDGLVTVRTTGATGTCLGNAVVSGNFNAAAPANQVKVSGTIATVVVDTTATKLIELTVQISSVSSNGVTVHNAMIAVEDL